LESQTQFFTDVFLKRVDPGFVQSSIEWGSAIKNKKESRKMESKPTHEQAQLHLQVYEQRREARLRQARDWFFRNYHVQTIEDTMRIAAPGTEGGAFAGMVLSYWEQACALLNYGLLHEDLFFQTSGEFFGVWELVKPVVPQAREGYKYKGFLANMEKAAQRYEAWIETHSPGHIAAMREFMKQMKAQLAKAA
jgi:hypothetical protein